MHEAKLRVKCRVVQSMANWLIEVLAASTSDNSRFPSAGIQLHYN